VDPAGNAVTIVSPANRVLHNETILANDGPGTWTVRLDLEGYTGEVGLELLQMG
jgi:hypothetical protein